VMRGASTDCWHPALKRNHVHGVRAGRPAYQIGVDPINCFSAAAVILVLSPVPHGLSGPGPSMPATRTLRGSMEDKVSNMVSKRVGSML
jgi:hypothetical protein